MNHHQNLNEITELCLGLPGAAAAPLATRTKRLFADTQDSLDGDFNLNLQAKPPTSSQPPRVPLSPSSKPSPPKAQVVGWPPVRAHRQNAMKSQKQAVATTTVPEEMSSTTLGGALVKVSIDGAPYLRKVDLKAYKCYQELSDALANLFSSFTKGSDGEDGMIDFMSASKLRDALNSSDFAKTYQDKDGDWMLIGDVPWEMFVNSCKRLRIMKKSEAKRLAENPVEKSS